MAARAAGMGAMAGGGAAGEPGSVCIALGDQHPSSSFLSFTSLTCTPSRPMAHPQAAAIASGMGITSPTLPEKRQDFFEITQSWQDLMVYPSHRRSNKREDKGKWQSNSIPDFTHEPGKETLLIENQFSPPWVRAATAQCQDQRQHGSSKTYVSGAIVMIEQMWQDLFSDPMQWWDNRSTKKSPEHPDFKHKITRDCLWVDDWRNPAWVKAKISPMALNHLQFSDGSKPRVSKSFRVESKLKKLCQEGQLKEALHLVKLMVQQRSEAPVDAFAFILKACAGKNALPEIKQVHALMIQTRCDSNILLANKLVHMYSKCGNLLGAHKVFTTMPRRNVFSWTAIISAYADSGRFEEAVNLFQQMLETDIAPDKVLFVIALKACAKSAAVKQGKQLHSLILKKTFATDLVVQNTLIDMYGKCRCPEDARDVFATMSHRNVFSWTAIISAYADSGQAEEAINLFQQMVESGVEPDKVVFVIVLKACASVGALKHGRQIYSLILKEGFQSDLFVQNGLIDMFAKCGSLEDARELFNNMGTRDVVSWNTMMAGYAQNGPGKEAVALYECMKQEYVQPDIVTYVVVLKACANIAALEQGKEVHLDIRKRGLESDIIVQSTLIDMYAKCGCLQDARKLFDKMSKRDVVSWNAMIAGYERHGIGHEALALFEQMKHNDMVPSIVTFILALKACTSIAALEQGKQLHLEIRERGFDSDLTVHSTLIDMYAKCGCLEAASQLFTNGRKEDVISWTVMIGGYLQNGLGKEAIALYEQMKQEYIQPDMVLFVLVLKACASIAALEQGKQLHLDIRKRGFEKDLTVQSALIDMYAKCGCLENARELFNNMSARDVVSWNAMIAGYAHNGLGKEALSLYEQMKQTDLQPDKVTYICVLSACSHSGLVNEGRHVFNSMCESHGLTPTVEHYVCMIDLLGRAGCLDNAEDFIRKLPLQPDRAVWMSLLGAARNHGHVETARHAFDCAVALEPESAAPFLLLSDIYTAAGSMDEVARVRKELEGKKSL